MTGRAGSSLRRLAAASLPLLLCAGPGGLTSPATAQPAPPQGAAGPIAISADSLAGAARQIARATGSEIVSLEPGLDQVRVPARRLPADPARALARLLAGTPFRAAATGPRSFRIERRPAPPRAVPASRFPGPDGGQAGGQTATPAAITVLASRFPTRLRDYPGSLVRLPTEGGAGLPEPSRLTDLAGRYPVVFSTAFGEGRDKLFVRGIADSSFNGAAQPTTAIYFDDARIGFGSPNPSLRLYDVASVEVLEGPQGTLYGGGSIGSVIRITPNPVELDRRTVSGSAQAVIPSGGTPGWRLSAATNLPLATDRVGLRLVGYTERAGGFIDDPLSGNNINQVDVNGGRAALTVRPSTGLRIDLGGLYQHTRSRDAQYVNIPRTLIRSPALPQPFGNELVLARAALRNTWDNGLELSGLVSFGHRSANDRFDAQLDVAGSGATAYDLQRSSSVWSGELRLARNRASGVSWVAGLGLERIADGQTRAFGGMAGVVAVDEVTNITRSGSLFAQGRLPIGARLQATAGLRFTVARTDSEPARGRAVSFIRGRPDHHFDPTLALLYRLDDTLSAYARFQTGYRNGGVTVARGVGKVSDFRPDAIAMGELGLRRRRAGACGLEWNGVVSFARWKDVLAELVTRRGTPITTNIGNARLLALEGSASWHDCAGWSLGGAALFTGNRLLGELSSQTSLANRRLPDTPAFSGHVDAGYEWRSPGGATRTVSASLHYVGRSILGPGPELDLSQGNYAVINAGISSRKGPLTLRLAVENLLNTRANRFALGNPLTLYQRQGFAPVMPRTIMIGASISG